jgi:hypothetical protein
MLLLRPPRTTPCGTSGRRRRQLPAVICPYARRYITPRRAARRIRPQGILRSIMHVAQPCSMFDPGPRIR